MSHDTIYGDLEAEDRKSRINGNSMQRIMQILGDTARVRQFENMEEPAENWGGESKFTLYIDNVSSTFTMSVRMSLNFRKAGLPVRTMTAARSRRNCPRNGLTSLGRNSSTVSQ